MSEDGVTIQNQNELDNLLRQLSPQNFMKVIVRASVKIAETIKGRIAVSAPAVRYPLKWASAAQRRAYFASRKDIGLPYRRISDPVSEKLEQSWVVKETQDGAILGNPASYADLVQSEENQTEMHAVTGWITDAKAVRQVEESGVIERIISAELADFFRSIGGT